MIINDRSTGRILVLLRQTADLLRAGKPIESTLRQLGISEAMYLSWRGEEKDVQKGLQKRNRDLKRENDQLHEVIKSLSVVAGGSKDMSGGDFQ